jgi:class 3 adenylate cyclase/predicted ATPase
MSANRQWFFASFRLDPATMCLWRDNQLVPLASKPFAVLAYLVAHAGQVVTKEALLEAVWPGTVVSEGVLKTSMGKLRQALGETARTPRYIDTVHGRGYRFIAPVEERLPESDDDRGSRRSTPASSQPPDSGPLEDAERRQLTVLFCDIVASTHLANQLDPEELRDLISMYHQGCAEVIQRYDGTIAQYLGDGILVYFGYPHAHEDDAQRAVRTGLGIIAAMQDFRIPAQPTLPMQLDVRIGIHTGLVVVGAVGGADRLERLALGEAPNVAARLQDLAAPNTVVISNDTYQLVQGYFLHQALGERSFKGIRDPLQIYRILDERRIQSRFDVAMTRGLTPLVGRMQELALLHERWEHVQEGFGQVVLLDGEAGIGKSRLVQEMKDHVANQPHSRIECQSSPYYQNTALYPIVDFLETRAGFLPDDPAEAKLAKLEHTLCQYTLPVEETVPYCAALLALPLPAERYTPLTLAPQRLREKILDTLVALIRESAAQQPVLFVVEDLHWSDPSTLELLDLLVKQGPTIPLLMLLTCRAEFHPPWGRPSHVTHLTLNPLRPHQVEQMLAYMTAAYTLPQELCQQVVAKADGIPLFVEEVTKWALESTLVAENAGYDDVDASATALSIPVTLHDSLMARLDRLGTAKSIAQLGATIGRQFSFELLQAVVRQDAASVQQELDRLVVADLLYQRGVALQATYTFKHALIQEAAYQALLIRTRRRYHQQIAQTIEERFPATVQTQPELLAHHYTAANLGEQAIGYWQRAGEHAAQRSANVEAIAHLRKGLEILNTLPESPLRTRYELTLLTRLCLPLAATKGYAAPELEDVNTRMRMLCQQEQEPTLLIGALGGLWTFYLNQAALQTAYEMAQQILISAQHLSRTAVLPRGPESPRRPFLWGHVMLGQALLFRGEFVPAHEQAAIAMSVYDPHLHRPQVNLVQQDPGVTCLANMAQALWHLGYPAQARQKSDEALSLAQTLSHPYSIGWVLGRTAILHCHCCDYQIAMERSQAAVALANAQGVAQWVAQGTLLQGAILAMQGDAQQGIVQMQKALQDYEMTGAKLLRPYFLALLATVYNHAGQAEAGCHVLDEALRLVDTTGERWYEAELYRLKGECQQQAGVDSETSFLQALYIARQQVAKAFELRAATSLYRLWQSQGRRDEAQHLLTEIYSWFTEGFDTADLQEARALLDRTVQDKKK